MPGPCSLTGVSGGGDGRAVVLESCPEVVFWDSWGMTWSRGCQGALPERPTLALLPGCALRVRCCGYQQEAADPVHWTAKSSFGGKVCAQVVVVVSSLPGPWSGRRASCFSVRCLQQVLRVLQWQCTATWWAAWVSSATLVLGSPLSLCRDISRVPCFTFLLI